MENPLLQAFEAAQSDWAGRYQARDRLCKEYAWAVPNQKALSTIARIAGSKEVIEVGAGRGYWASLLQKLGVKLTPYDNHAWGYKDQTFTEVLKGSFEKIDRNCHLFLCWPPYEHSLAKDCLDTWLEHAKRWDCVFYVGEGYGGCTGDDAFHETLQNELTEVDVVEIPNWYGIHDRLYVYKKA